MWGAPNEMENNEKNICTKIIYVYIIILNKNISIKISGRMIWENKETSI